MDIKETYGKWKELPSFEFMNSEFEIGNIESGNILLEVSKKVIDKTEKYRKILEEYLHADGSSIAVLMEIKEFNESDKEKVNNGYKELMILERNLLLAELENDDKKYAEFIQKSVDVWKKTKPEIKSLIEKAKESWQNTSKVNEELSYLM